MIARELVAMLAELAERPYSDIEQRTRPLRVLGTLPYGRGINATPISSLHAAAILLTMVPRRAADVERAGLRAMRLPSVPKHGALRDHLLAEALSAAISSKVRWCSQVEIAEDGSVAWLTSVNDDGKDQRLLFTDREGIRSAVAKDPRCYDTVGAEYCGHRMVFSRQLLDLVHRAGGWDINGLPPPKAQK